MLREPDAGDPPVRFDEGELNGRAAVQFSTLPGHLCGHNWGRLHKSGLKNPQTEARICDC